MQIPMQDTICMGMRDPLDHLDERGQGGLPIHSGTRESRGQRAPRNEIHQQRGGLRDREDVMDGEDVGVAKARLDAPFLQQAFPQIRMDHMQDLQCVERSEHGVANPVHRRSPALSEHQLDTMASNDVARLKHASSSGRSVAGGASHFFCAEGVTTDPAFP